MSFVEELKRRNVIRVGLAYALIAWVLLQGADFAFDLVGAPDWVIRTLFILAAIGLPAALVFAWVYEMTPEGLKREKDIDPAQSITHHTGRKLDRTIIVFLVLVIALMAAERLFLADRPGGDGPRVPEPAAAKAGTQSIAVLPFVNMSADADNEFFSDGVSEEILNVLARIPDLKVTARTSAFTFKGSDATVAEIARELGVNHVLEGSVRKSGNQVRVTAQLIEAATGFHLWSETYDRELTNIFAIQDEIAQAIAAALQVRLLPAAEQPNLTGTTDLEAYEYYLQGVGQWHLRTGPSLERARELFERAIARDPGFARAHAYLALTWAILHDYTDRPPTQTYSNAGQAAREALALDSNSIEAATAMIYSTDDIRQQLEFARQAIALNPGFATTHQWYATTLHVLGDHDGAEREYRMARELDPRSRVINENLAYLLFFEGRFDEAEQAFRHLESFAPEYLRAPEGLFQIALVRGQREIAEARGNELARRLGRMRNATPVYLDLFFAPDRSAAAAAEIVSWPMDDWDNPDNPSLIREFELAAMLAAAGAHREALDALGWLHQHAGVYVYGSIRAAHFIPDFLCSPEAEAFFATTNLPPLVEPYPCP